ncbi:response regulator [Pseudanabaena cinerea]|nr:hypothetical protein [Pseudanabaena cinerea]
MAFTSSLGGTSAALAMEGDRDRCLGVGANEYISKPIKLKQLAVLIQELL